MTEEQQRLRSELLEAELSSEEAPATSKLARSWKMVLVVLGTIFVAYHTTILLVWNTPSKGLAKTFHKQILDKTKGRPYFRGTSNSQSWSMFAPNPNRTNVFIRVLVTDANDDTFDLKHDIYGVNRYPYMFYDRMGKINRRIDGKKNYLRSYGAWVCRQWERDHGTLPKHVQFVKRWTRVPHPAEAVRKGWTYGPWDLPSKQKNQDKIVCSKTVHAQLSPKLRERYGMEPSPEDHFRPVRLSTWYSKAQQELDREARRLEREAKKTKNAGSTKLVPPADPFRDA